MMMEVIMFISIQEVLEVMNLMIMRIVVVLGYIFNFGVYSWIFHVPLPDIIYRFFILSD